MPFDTTSRMKLCLFLLFLVYLSHGVETTTTPCNRSDLPWGDTAVQLEQGIEDKVKRYIRTRLFEQLPSYCCNLELAFIEQQGKTIVCEADRKMKIKLLEQESGNGVYADQTVDPGYAHHAKCKQRCWNQQEHFIMRGTAERDTACYSAEYIVDQLDSIEYFPFCPIFSKNTNDVDVIGPSCSLSDSTGIPANHNDVSDYRDFGGAKPFDYYPQCQIHTEFGGYEAGLCESKTSGSCKIELRPYDQVFLACTKMDEKSTEVKQSWDHKHSILIDSIKFEQPGEKQMSACNSIKDSINIYIKLSGYPMETAFNMLQLGLKESGCANEWVDFTRELHARVKLEYHCAVYTTIPSSSFAEYTRPESWKVEKINEQADCRSHATAFDEKGGKKLEYCTTFVTEKVSNKWRCMSNCIAYLRNAYNDHEHTHSKHICRAAVIKEIGKNDELSITEYSCTMYDWMPAERPTRLISKGCVEQDDDHSTLIYLKEKCYEDPATASAVLGSNIVKPLAFQEEMCRMNPSEAFLAFLPNSETAMGHNCSRILEGVPMKDNKREFFGRTSPDGKSMSWINWATELTKENSVFDKLMEQFGATDQKLHQFYCLHECRKKKTCAAVTTFEVLPEAGGILPFCLFKLWTPTMTDNCYNKDDSIETSNPIEKIKDIREYELKKECYNQRADEATQEKFEGYLEGRRIFEIKTLGCFEDSADPSTSLGFLRLNELENSYHLSKHTPLYCAQKCSIRSYYVSGVNEKECICLTEEWLRKVTLRKRDVKKNRDFCFGDIDVKSIPCSGNAQEKCGSKEHSLYFAISEKVLELKGCYQPPKDMPELLVAKGDPTLLKELPQGEYAPEECANWCLEQGHFIYSAIHTKLRCTCGNAAPGLENQNENQYWIEDGCKFNCDDGTKRCVEGFQIAIFYNHKSFKPLDDKVYLDSKEEDVSFLTCYLDSSPLHSERGSVLSIFLFESQKEVKPGNCAFKCNFFGRYTISAVEERGCYRKEESGTTLLKAENPTDNIIGRECPNTNTPATCSRWCYQNEFKLAGIQSSKCYCGDGTKSGFGAQRETSCQELCTGDQSKQCGSETTGTIALFLSVQNNIRGRRHEAMSEEMCSKLDVGSRNEQSWYNRATFVGKTCLRTYGKDNLLSYSKARMACNEFEYGRLVELESDNADSLEQFRLMVDGHAQNLEIGESLNEWVFWIHSPDFAQDTCQVYKHSADANEAEITTHTCTNDAKFYCQYTSYDCTVEQTPTEEEDQEGKKQESKIKQCIDYLDAHGRDSQTQRARECRRLLGIPEPKGKYEQEWCKAKIDLHGGRKPNLKCVMKCQKLWPVLIKKPPKYSIKYCNEIVETYNRKPKLSCVKECKKILESGTKISTTTKSPTKYSVEYCRFKMDTYGTVKPKLQCVEKCETLMGTTSAPTKQYKYSNKYCKEKIKKFGYKKPPLKCVTKCKKLLGY